MGEVRERPVRVESEHGVVLLDAPGGAITTLSAANARKAARAIKRAARDAEQSRQS